MTGRIRLFFRAKQRQRNSYACTFSTLANRILPKKRPYEAYRGVMVRYDQPSPEPKDDAESYEPTQVRGRLRTRGSFVRCIIYIVYKCLYVTTFEMTRSWTTLFVRQGESVVRSEYIVRHHENRRTRFRLLYDNDITITIMNSSTKPYKSKSISTHVRLIIVLKREKFSIHHVFFGE